MSDATPDRTFDEYSDEAKNFYRERLLMHPAKRGRAGVIGKDGGTVGFMVMVWCASHEEPVWLYSDGSATCPYDLTVRSANEHKLEAGTWEKDSDR